MRGIPPREGWVWVAVACPAYVRSPRRARRVHQAWTEECDCIDSTLWRAIGRVRDRGMMWWRKGRPGWSPGGDEWTLCMFDLVPVARHPSSHSSQLREWHTRSCGRLSGFSFFFCFALLFFALPPYPAPGDVLDQDRSGDGELACFYDSCRGGTASLQGP